MKIPFDIKYRPQIESGEYKVETRDGLPARIIYWDRIGVAYPIVALVPKNSNEEILTYTNEGTFYKNASDKRDLIIITLEKELSEFETRLLDWLSDDTSGEISMERMKELVKNRAAELLSIARKQLIEERYTSDPRKTDLYKLGKAEALKDLPTWEKYPYNAGEEPLVNGILQEDGSYKWRLYLNGYKIEISDLEKLPGFKEN